MLAGKCKPWGYIDVFVFMTHREHYEIDHNSISQWIEKSTSTDDFFEHLYEHMRQRFGTEVFIEKSPTNVYAFDTLAKNHSSIPLIHLVRDGRDVAASLMKRGFNLYAAGTRWLYDTLCGLNARGSERYLEVAYEDMVSTTDAVLTTIFKHIGVEPNNYLSLSRSNTPKPGEYSEEWKSRKEPNAWNQTPADPISTASIGRYKTAFSKEDLSTLYRIRLTRKAKENISSDIQTFGELIEHLGYENRQPRHRDLNGRVGIQIRRLEWQDYLRRLNRFHNNSLYALPKRYSEIS